MGWRKNGLVYAPNGELEWARSYAHLPTVDILDKEILRVYFASLDQHQFGRIGYVELDARNPQRVLDISPQPILDLGEPGTFDDSGVNPSCVLNVDGAKYLYYIGWQRCECVPYMLFAGLAISEDGKHFERASRVPVLDRTRDEPFLRSATTILRENGMFRAWYVSGLGWTDINAKPYPTYVIRYAESVDGLGWRPFQHICIDFQDDAEFGFGRPWVVREGNLYRMWYSIRSRTEPYRIGYAESRDGITWTRKDDQVGIVRSSAGWDSEMICYPCVISIHGNQYMFYNGNRHGASGFGYATFETGNSL